MCKLTDRWKERLRRLDTAKEQSVPLIWDIRPGSYSGQNIPIMQQLFCCSRFPTFLICMECSFPRFPCSRWVVSTKQTREREHPPTPRPSSSNNESIFSLTSGCISQDICLALHQRPLCYPKLWETVSEVHWSIQDFIRKKKPAYKLNLPHHLSLHWCPTTTRKRHCGL